MPLEAQLRAAALAYPQAWEDFPWGERVIKVGKKVFCFCWGNDDGVGFTVKLPISREFALAMPGTEPTGYGLGRSGWVTCRLTADCVIDPDLLLAWLDESYRAIAPKRLIALLPPVVPGH